MGGLTLNILVEGRTEKAVLKDFLRPYWERRFQNCVVLMPGDGAGILKTKYIAETRRLLSLPDQAVLILMDIKNDPFGVSASAPSHVAAYRQLQEVLYRGLGANVSESDRLGVFPVVQEVETWLLADPNVMSLPPPHPEHETEPAAQIPRYGKGVRAKPFYKKADVEAVYADNCPHFVYLADWLQGKTPSETPSIEGVFTPEQQASLDTLMAQYSELAARINRNIKNGQTAAAGVLRTELIYIQQQIQELNASLY